MPTLSLATTFCTPLSGCSPWCWFMLHINILMSSLRGLRKKQKPTPTPAFVCIVYAASDWVSCNPLNVISQWQSQQSTQQDQSPPSPSPASLLCHCLRTFVLCRGGRKLLRASHNSQLQLQARSTRTCLSCLAPFGKFNYSKSHANELDGKVKQQTGRGKEGEKQGEKEDSTENQTEKRVSNFQIAYRLRFFLFNLRWNCLFFATRANDIKSLTLTHYLPIYALPSLSPSPSCAPPLALLISRGVILPRLQIQFTFLI